MVKKRNGEIDVWRLVFSVIVVIFHFNINYDFEIFSQGNICVEFFFVVSGFLLARQVQKYTASTPGKKLSGKEIADSTWRFTSKKIGALYAYYFSVVILQVIIRNIIINKESSDAICNEFLKSIPTFTLSFMGLVPHSDTALYVGNTWFLSAMLIALLLLYPLLLRSYDFSAKIVCPLLALFILGSLYADYNSITVWKRWADYTYSGVIRALGGFCIGISLCPLSDVLQQKLGWLISSKKVAIKLPLTAIKLFCYGIMIWFAFGKDFDRSFNIHAMLFCAVGILLTFSDVGYGIPDCALTRFLGKISLPIFIYHGFIRWVCADLIPFRYVTGPIFAALIIGSIVASVILMYLTDLVMLLLKKLVSKIKQHC